MNTFGVFMTWYCIITIVLSAIILFVPPIRRWYFRMFARLYAEAVGVMFPIIEKIFEKFE